MFSVSSVPPDRRKSASVKEYPGEGKGSVKMGENLST